MGEINDWLDRTNGARSSVQDIERDLSPQEMELVKYHRDTIAKGQVGRDPQGRPITVYSNTIETPDGRYATVPGYYDGTITEDPAALLKKWGPEIAAGKWPVYDDPAQADSRAKQIHGIMDLEGDGKPAAKPSPLAEWLQSDPEGDRLKLSIQEGAGRDSGRATRILQLQLKTGLPKPYIEDNLDTVEAVAAKQDFNPDLFRRRSRSLAAWIAEHPDHAAAVKEDLTKLSYVERQYRYIGGQYERGNLTTELADLGLKAMEGSITPAERARAGVIQKAMAETDNTDITGFFEQIPGQVANQIPIQLRSIAGKVKAAGEGTAIGAAAGAAAGAATVNPALPAVGATLGALSGWRYGAAVEAGKMEAALAFLDYEQLKDEKGQPLDRQTVLGLSGMVGVVNGALEGLTGIERALNKLPGVRNFSRSGIKQLLDSPSARSAILGYAKTVGAVMLEEGATEGVQSMVTAAGKVLAKATGSPTDILGEIFSAENLSQAVQEARAGAQGGGGMGAVVAVPSLAVDLREAKQAKQTEQVWLAIGQATESTKMREALPEHLQRIIADATKDGPIETVYMPTDAFNTYFQSKGVDPREAAAAITGNVEAYDQAIQTGQDLPIRTEDYATKIAPTEHNAFFAHELRTAIDAMNAREAEEWQAQIEAEDQAAAAQADPAIAQANDAAAKVRQDIAGQLQAAGFDPTVADQYAALYEARYRARAERRGLGEDPFELFQKLHLTVTKQIPEILKTLGGKTSELDALLNRLRVGDLPKESEVFGQSLTDFLKEKGGLQDQGGELSSRNVDAGRQPFQKNLIQANGLTLDQAAELAAEAGYLENRDLAELLDALDKDSRGKPVYAIGRENASMLDVHHNLEALKNFLADREINLTETSNDQIKAMLGESIQQSLPAAGGQTFAQLGDTIVVDGVERSTTNSEGQPIAPTQQALENFWRWFGDSKVVDGQGRPRVVYHGTTGNFETFDTAKLGANTDVKSARLAFFFTDDARTAASYGNYAASDARVQRILKEAEKAEKRGDWDTYEAKIIEAEKLDASLSDVQNRMNGQTVMPVYLRIENPVETDAEGETYTSIEGGLTGQISQAKRQKRDGVIIRNLDDAVGLSNHVSDHFAVFGSQQIKSALANAGTFSPNSPNILYQSVYHGTPHAWAPEPGFPHGRPRLDKIGTGEGAQAYGWGIYFAENKEVADSYTGNDIGGAPVPWLFNRNGVELEPGTPEAKGADLINSLGLKPAQAFTRRTLKEFQAGEAWTKEPGQREYWDRVSAFVNDVQSKREISKRQGNLYNLDIPDEVAERLIDWDKPIGEQSDSVKAALEKIAPWAKTQEHKTGEWVLGEISEGLPGGMGGKVLAEKLRDAGIPGVKYLDMGSRRKVSGTSNFVLWDQDALDKVALLKRNEKKLDAIRDNTLYQSKPAGSIESAIDALKEEFPSVEFFLSAAGYDHSLWTLHDLVIPKEIRNQGQGSRFMERLVEYADQQQATIVLSPAERGDGKGTTSKSRLVEFYKRFGFELNKGRKKDYRYSELMYRRPELHQGDEGLHKGAITFGDNLIDIKLLEGADLSTFIHETGHLYLNELIDDATTAGVPEQLRTDLDAVLKWMGLDVRVADGRDKIRAAVQTAQHEQWARGFEAYTLEGKAPSQAMREAFARFRQWLVHVYRLFRKGVDAAGQVLDVKLSNEVREVMDRLIATDQEIEAAAAEAEVLPLFTDAAQAGMSDAQWANYQELVGKASRTAREILQAKLMAQLNRQQATWWKEARTKMLQAVTEEVNAQPEYTALAVLQTGTLPDGSPLPDGIQPMKLDRKGLADVFGKDFLKRMPRKTTAAKEGMHHETAAQIFGYTSGHDFVMALVNARDKRQLIEAETDRRMQEEYGDLRFDGTLAEAARVAVLNEHQEEVIAAEIRAISKKRREVAPFVKTAVAEVQAQHDAERAAADAQRTAEARAARYNEQAGKATFWEFVPSLDTVRETARQQISKATIRTLKPYAYFIASQKASRAAVKALADKDYMAAGVAKQKELLNLALFREATAAIEEAERIAEHMRELAKKPAQERLGKAGADYLDQINELLSRFEFTKISLQRLDQRHTLAQWIAAKESAGETMGEEFDVPESVLNESKRVNYRELAYEELLGIRDVVKQIEHFAALKNKLLKAQKARDKDAARDALIAAIETNLADKGPPPLTKAGLTRGEKVTKLAQQFDASLLKMEQVVEWLDGGATGPWHDYFWNPAADAQAAEYDATKTITAKIAAAVAGIPKEIRAHMLDTVAVSGIEAVVTRKDLLGVALNVGNQSNYDKLLKGMNWTGDQVEAMLGHLTEEEWRFVQSIWDTLESLYPEISALQKRLTGLPLEKIPARPVVTRFGTFAGGYYPIMYSSVLSDQGQLQLASNIGGLLDEGYTRATVPSGHRKGRVEGFARPFDLDVDRLPNHIAGVVKDLTHREWLLDANWIANDPEIRAVLQRRLGDPLTLRMTEWVRQVVNDRNQSSLASLGVWHRMVEHFRYNVMIVAMGFKASTLLSQLSGVAPAIEVIGGKDQDGAKWFAKGVGEVLRRPQSAYDFMVAKSGEMRHRLQTRDRDVRDQLRVLEGKTDALSELKQTSMMAIGYVELMVSMPSWFGAYYKALDAGQDEEAAVRMGDRAVRLGQGAGGAKDLAAVAAKSDAIMRVLTMFYSPFSALYGRLRTIGHDVNGIGDAPGAAFRLFWVVVVAATLGELAAGHGPDDKKEESWLAWWLKSMAAYPFLAVPMLRDAISAITTGYGYQFSPMAQALKVTADTVKTAEGAIAGDKELGDLAAKTVQAMSYLVGLPTGQLTITGTYLYDLANGTAHPDNLFQFAKGFLYKRTKEERGQ